MPRFFFLPGIALEVQYLRRALDAGDPLHLARGIAAASVIDATQRPELDATQEFERARDLAAHDPKSLADVERSWGLAHLAKSDFRGAIVHLTLAQELLHTHCPGEAWQLTSARMYLGSAWGYSGDYASIIRIIPGWLEEARARDDRFALAALVGFGAGYTRHLAAGQPELALTEIEEAMSCWPQAPSAMLHFGAIQGVVSVLSYQAPERALAWLAEREASMERSLLLKTPTCRSAIVALRAQLTVATGASLSGARRAHAFATARRNIKTIARLRTPLAPVMARLFEAAILALEGRREEALRLASTSASALADLGHFYRPALEYMCALLRGGETGTAHCRQVLHHYEEQGFAEPRAALYCHFPPLKAIEALLTRS